VYYKNREGRNKEERKKAEQINKENTGK